MSLIRTQYEVQQNIGLDRWTVRNWPISNKRQALSLLRYLRRQSPHIEYRVVRVTREVVSP